MEYWEREYEKTLDEIKANELRSRKRKKRRKDTINRNWEEVIQADGTKLYVPKTKRIRRQKKWQILRSGLSSGVKSVFFIALVIFVIISVLVFAPHLKKLYTKGLNATIFSSVSTTSSDTYVNGIQMKNMVDIFTKIRDEHNATLGNYIESHYTFTDQQLSSWLASIDEDLATVQELYHDPSYDTYVNVYISFLENLKEYISAVRAADWDRVKEAHAQYVTLLSQTQITLINAFKENNVPYEFQNDGTLRFTYQSN